jgi:5'-nucleotidase
MKWTALSLLLIGVAAGCMNHAKQGAMYPNSSALDVAAAPAPPQQYQPAPAQPVYDATAAQPVSATPASGAAGANKYTVKQGDTLWKIATARYGNGNQWQRIASANPGLTAETLKAGQTITIP